MRIRTFIVAIILSMSFGIVFAADSPKDKAISGEQASLLAIDSRGLKKLINESSSTLTLLNFWATWCDPCVEEFPDIVTLSKIYTPDNLRVIFVSTDFQNNLTSVWQFLNKQNFDLVSYYKNEGDNTFINAMNPEWSGALPATFIYDATGSLLDFWVGKRTLEELRKVVGKYLNVTIKLGD